MTLTEALTAADRWLLAWERRLLVALLVGIIGLSAAQILQRSLAAGGWFWADTVMRHGVLWLALVGASVTAAEGRHLSIDLFRGALSARAGRILSGTTGLITAAVTALMVVLSARLVSAEMRFGGTLVGTIPLWVSQIVLVLGFAGMTVRFLARGIRAFSSAPIS